MRVVKIVQSFSAVTYCDTSYSVYVIDLQTGNQHVFTIILLLGSIDEFVVMNLSP